MIFYDFYYGILVERIFLWFLWFFTCHICGNGFCSFLFQSLMVFMVFMIFMILNFLFMFFKGVLCWNILIMHFSYLTLLKDLRKTHSELWYIFCISTCYPSCFIKWRFFNKPKACRKMLLMSSFTPNLFSLYTPTHLSLSPLHLSAPPHLSTSTCASPPPCNSMFKSYYIIRSQARVWGVFQETVQYFSVWWIMNRMDHTQLGGAFRSW